MVRPCFLVVDYEYPGSISTRKLVLETAKFNVITAYSNVEAIETLRRFPAVDGVVLNAHVGGGLPCAEVSSRMRSMAPDLPIIVTSSDGHADCGPVTLQIPGFEPDRLLQQLRTICQRRAIEIAEHEQTLRDDMER